MEKQKKWIAVVLIVLLSANLILQVVFFIQSPYFKRNISKNRDPKKHGNPGDRLVRELQFDAQQKISFEQLKNDLEEKMDNLIEREKQNKKEQFVLLKEEQFAKSTLDSLATISANIEKERDLLLFDHFKKIKAICNESQKATYNELIVEILDKYGKHHPPPPPPPNAPPPPPMDREE